MRLVLAVVDGLPLNYCVILSPVEAVLWEENGRARHKLRRLIKRRASQLMCPVVSVYRMDSLIESWKVKSVDW